MRFDADVGVIAASGIGEFRRRDIGRAKSQREKCRGVD